MTFTTGDATHFTTTTYWKAADGTLVVRSVDHEEHSSDQDDGQGGGGGGGGVGGGRQYTVQDDGTVKYTEDGHTYTANDDLAGDVRDAARSGDASTLSTVDRVSVSDESGDVVAANFEAPEPAGGGVAATPAGISAAEITQIEASNAELLEYADALGIGYDGQRPDFAQIRADVQQTADRQNADYVNHYLGEGTVPEGTHPTQEQIQQAGAVAADVDSLGRTSAPSQARVAADIGAQNREYVNHYLGEGTVPEGTHPTREQIQQAGAVAADVDSLARTSAPSQARVSADIGAQNREYVNHYLGEGTVPEGTHPTQEQIQQAGAVAADVDSLGRTSAPSQARVAADIGAQNREYVNHYLGEGTVPEGTHPTQEQIQQAGAVAADVDSLGRTSAPSQARVAADIGAQNRDFVNHYLGEGTVPDGTYPTQEQIQQASVFAAFAADDAADINERVAADLGLPADTNPAEVERAARSRAAEIEQGFRDSVLDTAPAPGSFVSSVLDSQIDAGGLPTNHPDFPEYDRIRTALDGPHWRSEQIADSTQQLLKNTTVATVDVGGAVDAFRAIGTGRHISQFDSSVPIDANLGLVPFAGTLADLNVRGRDGYSRADLAWLAGQGVLDVVPLPSGGTLVRTSKGVFLVARHPGAAAQIAIGGRRTVQSVTQGTGRAPYQLTGSRTKPAGVANIPVAFGREAIIDDLPVSAAEALLHQRDLAFAQYRATGVPQAIEVPTVGGGTQTVYVGGSRAGMETGRGAATHTSATAGEIALASAEPGGVISRPKFDATGNLLPDVENRFFVTATGAPSLVGGAALPSQRSAVSGPGFIDLVDPDNVANVGPVRKVFGGDIDTGMMRPGAVVELEAGIPAHQRIAGGDGSQLYRERPVGLQSVGGQTVHRYVDLSPAQQSGRLRVIQSNVLAGIDNLRGRTDSFYVVHRNADGTTDVVRQADLDALARSGVAPEDALRIETRSGDLRLISRQEWESSARAVSRLADGDTDESLEDRDANDRRDRDDRDGDRGGDFPLGRTNAADRNVPVASNQRAPEPRPTREGLTSQLRLPEDLTRVGIPTEPPPDVPTRGTPGAPTNPPPDVPTRGTPGAPTNPPPDVPTRGTPGAPTEPPPDVPTRGTPGAPTNPPPDVPTRGTPGTPANPPPDVPTRVPQTLRRLPGLQPPSRIPGLTKPERDRPDGDGPDAGRVELPNPVEDDPNLHPQEVRYYEVVEHTVALPSGEHTIEPVDDTALRTAEITAVGPKNPMGNVHRAGSVVLEVEDDRIVLESATRRRDANLRTAEDGAVDYSKLEYPRTEATLTSEQLAALDMPASSVDYSKLELPTSGNSLTDEQIAAIEPPKYGEQTDYTAINPGQEFRATGLGDYSHLQMPTGTEFGGGELQGGQSDRSARRPLKRPETRAELEKFQAGYRQVVGREPTGDLNRDLATYQEVVDARSKSGKSSSGVGGMDYSKLEYPAGQGPAATRNRPRSANSIDPGLVGGGRGMGRRGGGKRKREQEDDEKSKYRRPVVQVVLEN